MKLYKRCGFQMVQFLEGFYVIDGVSYSSYLYVLYLDELRHPPHEWAQPEAQPEAPPADAGASNRGEGSARSPSGSPREGRALAAPAREAAGDADEAASSSGACALG